MEWIQFLIVLGVVCIVIGAVYKIVQMMGFPIHPVVWIIAAAIVGIIFLIWLGRVLPHLLSALPG
jgi:hypothetical protein